MKNMIFLFFLVVFVIALIFSLLNMQPVQVNFYYRSVDLPFALVLTLELVAGVIIGVIASFMQIFRLKAQCAKLKKQLSGVEKELELLRSKAVHAD